MQGTVCQDDRSLIAVEPGVHDPCGIIDVGHKDTPRPPAFKPIVVRAVHLEHLSVVVLSLPPLPVSFMLTVFLSLPCFKKPGADCLPTDSHAFTLFELLGKEGGAEVWVVHSVEINNLLFKGELSL